MACLSHPTPTDVIERDNKELPTCVEFDIPFPSSFHAETAYNSLRVDSEPKRGSTLKSILLEGNILKVSLESSNTRQLRTALNSFMDLLILVSETIDAFGGNGNQQV